MADWRLQMCRVVLVSARSNLKVELQPRRACGSSSFSLSGSAVDSNIDPRWPDKQNCRDDPG